MVSAAAVGRVFERATFEWTAERLRRGSERQEKPEEERKWRIIEWKSGYNKRRTVADMGRRDDQSIKKFMGKILGCRVGVTADIGMKGLRYSFLVY